MAAQQIAALEALRSRRDAAGARQALGRLRTAAAGEENLLPVLIDSVKAYATVGEICDVLREVFGEYHGAQVY